MDAKNITRAPSFNEHGQAGGELEVVSNIGVSIEVMPSGGDLIQEMESAGEILTRIELDLARSSEKSLNLDNLAMHVATRESDFETFLSEKEWEVGDSAQRAVEFDLLSGILESEVTELENYLLNLQSKIEHAYEMMSSSKYRGETVKLIRDKLSDSVKSLKQTLEQISELRVQSNNFNQMVLISAGGKDGKLIKDTRNGYLPDVNPKLKMQTAEQRKHVLIMLGKSLERELDLEKKLAESRQSEELSKHRLQQEVLYMEEEVEITLGKLFEAENASEILRGMSKELMSRLRILKFQYNGSTQREGELKSRCEDLNEQLKVRNSDAGEMKSLINQLREGVAKAEQRAESLEVECRCLRETNKELNKDLNVVKSSEKSASKKATLLEEKLRVSDIQLQHAVASVEAGEEKRIMLESVVKDMQNLIDDLKSKVSRGKRQTESAEEKCIILSESNSNLNEELNFLRSRMESLEASLQQTEETKKATVIDISVRTKMITDLIMQLSSERERLHKQISLLTREKKILSKRLLQQPMTKDHSASIKKSSKGTKLVHETSDASSVGEVVVEATNLPGTGNERVVTENVMMGSGETVLSDSMVSAGTLRNIDARQLNRTYMLVAVGVLLLSVVASLFAASE